MAVGTAWSSRDTSPALKCRTTNLQTAGYTCTVCLLCCCVDLFVYLFTVVVCCVVCLFTCSLLLFVCCIQDEDGESVYSQARYQLPVPSFMGEVTVVSMIHQLFLSPFLTLSSPSLRMSDFLYLDQQITEI